MCNDHGIRRPFVEVVTQVPGTPGQAYATVIRVAGALRSKGERERRPGYHPWFRILWLGVSSVPPRTLRIGNSIALQSWRLHNWATDPSQFRSPWPIVETLQAPKGNHGLQGKETKGLEASRKTDHDKSEEANEFNRANHPPSPPLKDRKRPREVADPVNHIPTERPRKRLRSLPASCALGQTGSQEGANAVSASQRTHISHWAEQKTWPRDYFQQDSMHHLIARQKSTASLRRKRSDASLATSVTPSDQRPREEKSALYRDSSYPTLLETLGDSYMDESMLGITDASKVLAQNLLEKEHTTPRDTLFRDDVFHTACRNLRDKNEARILLDIARLLAPSPESLAAFGDKNLDILVESINEGWNNCIPVTNPRPQPDFAVGFGRAMFSDDQLSKLQPLLGDPSCLSYFRATFYMYFPFLTCEVKCGTTGLDIADRQNSHSMTLAVRGIVELFKLAKRENELHRELLTFSISHDHRTVRLYGYYPILEGPKIRIYRHPIHTFDITALDGKERWTTYKFTVAVYNRSLTLLKSIRSVIDDLPPNFNVEYSQQSEPQLSETTRIALENRNLVEASSSQSNLVDLQQITPDTSTQMENPASRKKKKGKV